MNSERWQKIKSILEKAIEIAPSSRSAYLDQACGGDENLRCEIESLLAFENDGDALEDSAFSRIIQDTAGVSDDVTGKRFGNYKILEKLGEGGMGAVFLAERDDGEFRQQVAVKIIKNGSDKSMILRRFLTERQILAHLEHANIARLIDGGTSAGGAPYFVMEYVEGTPVTEYARANDLSLIERLDLFREICAGVSYAHSNLVIHRDLKPSNILITKNGTPKLLDFGIAKLLKTDSTDGETRTHTLACTPEYASPEQLRGENLTTATDIYSLGVILYELLTDTRPLAFEGKNFGQIIETSGFIEPPRPSSALNPKSVIKNPQSLQGDLDNIILKALKKETKRRYLSVEQFSEDIRRYLRGLPVTARQDTLRYRAEKFTKRNPLVIGATALAFLILIGGIIAVGRQAQIADAERARAERRFNDVRTLANSFMFEINELIDENPMKARELLVKRAQEYLDKLAAESEGDTELQSELATAYQKIGDVQSELYRSNIGDTQGALENYAKALKIHEQLYLAEPANLSAGLRFSASCVKMGEISAKTGNITAAMENYSRAVNLNEQFISIDSQNAQARRQLAESLLKLGQAVFRTGNLSEVSAIYHRSLSIYEELAAENPADAKLQRAPAVLLYYIGFVFAETGDHAAALNSHRKSLQISERILETEPDNLQARRDRREFYHWIGIEYKNLGDTAASLAHHQKSQLITRELLSRDETDVQERNTLADSQMETAKTLVQAGRFTDALASFNDAIRNYEQVREADKKNAHVRRQISYTKLYLADALARSGKINEALEMYENSLPVFKELTESDRNNSEWQNDLAFCQLKTGETFLSKGDKTTALVYFRQALPIYEKLVAQSPENANCRRNLETLKSYLGKIENKE